MKKLSNLNMQNVSYLNKKAVKGNKSWINGALILFTTV